MAHLKDQDVTVDFRQVTTPDDRGAVIATQPLTDNETWPPIAPDSIKCNQVPHLTNDTVYRIIGTWTLAKSFLANARN